MSKVDRYSNKNKVTMNIKQSNVNKHSLIPLTTSTIALTAKRTIVQTFAVVLPSIIQTVFKSESKFYNDIQSLSAEMGSSRATACSTPRRHRHVLGGDVQLSPEVYFRKFTDTERRHDHSLSELERLLSSPTLTASRNPNGCEANLCATEILFEQERFFRRSQNAKNLLADFCRSNFALQEFHNVITSIGDPETFRISHPHAPSKTVPPPIVVLESLKNTKTMDRLQIQSAMMLLRLWRYEYPSMFTEKVLAPDQKEEVDILGYAEKLFTPDKFKRIKNKLAYLLPDAPVEANDPSHKIKVVLGNIALCHDLFKVCSIDFEDCEGARKRILGYDETPELMISNASIKPNTVLVRTPDYLACVLVPGEIPPQHIEKWIQAALEAAKNQGCRNVVFPPLGCDYYSPTEVVQRMFFAIYDWLDESQDNFDAIDRVCFCSRDHKIHKKFSKLFKLPMDLVSPSLVDQSNPYRILDTRIIRRPSAFRRFFRRLFG